MTEMLFRDEAYLRSCSARVIGADARGIRLDRTVCYPMGGGQPGDTGVLRLSAGHAITSVVTGAVTGGQVADGRGRLDFDVPGSSLDKEVIASRLNALIAAGYPVGPRWITDEELAAQPELVRTMSVKPPSGTGRVRLMEISGVDLQPCGGTHVRNTAEIGPVIVAKIENKGRQNRRVILAFAE